ncbi:MAG: rod shape-determining protein MreC [Planctomycetaceae bacterium]
MVRRRPSIFVLVSLLLLALILFLAPEEVGQKLSLSVRESLKPGLLLIVLTKEAWPEVKPVDHSEELEQLKTEVAALQGELQTARSEAIRLQEQVTEQQQFVQFPFRAEKSTALVLPELVSARVLSEPLQYAWKNELLLDSGSSSGVSESHWVLSSEKPVLDLGEDHQVDAEDLVLSGRVVVGRVSQVGHWSSTIQGVTDEEFSARARLIRQVGQQFVTGAEGLLVGTGEGHCELTLVSHEEVVHEGDDVYTVPAESPKGYPLYFGKVIKAELDGGSLEWTIQVEPAVQQTRFTQVEILRQKMNPNRMLGN